MDVTGPAAVPHRNGQLLVCPIAAEPVSKMNQSIESVHQMVTATNPTATPPSPITAGYSIHKKQPCSAHLMLIHRLDYRHQPAVPVGSAAAFSRPKYALSQADYIQLGTPAIYRDREDLNPGLRDQHDGQLTRDARKWAQEIIPQADVHSASVSFVARGEPWVFCASHYREMRELRRLKRHFAKEHAYTAATRLTDPDAFALWLGIDFSLALQETRLVKLSALDRLGYENSRITSDISEESRPIDTIVHVYHGPVHYEKTVGKITRQEEWFDPFAGPTAWFTKKPELEVQGEYRFAVRALGDPIQQRLRIRISPELRDLTVAL